MRTAKVMAAWLAMVTGLGGVAGAQAQDYSAFDVAFGAAITSNYVDAGISQSANGPAVQAYIEKTFGMAYGGLWASTVRFEDEADVEMTVYAGIRPEWGPLEFDFGLGYTFYPGGLEDPEFELHTAAEWEALDWLTFEKEISWSPGENEWEFEGGAEIGLGNGFALFGGLGYALFSEIDETDYLFWHVGASWTYADTLTIAAYYTDTNLTEVQCDDDHDAPNICGPAFLATLSFDTSLSKLFGWGGAGGGDDDD